MFVYRTTQSFIKSYVYQFYHEMGKQNEIFDVHFLPQQTDFYQNRVVPKDSFWDHFTYLTLTVSISITLTAIAST